MNNETLQQVPLIFEKKVVTAVLSQMYLPQINRIYRAIEQGKLPVVYGRQSIGKSGIIANYLQTVDSPILSFEIGEGNSKLMTLKQNPFVLFVTLRNGDRNEAIKDYLDLFDQLQPDEVREPEYIELTFSPSLEIIKKLIKENFQQSELTGLDDPWCENLLNQVLRDIPQQRPLDFLLNRLLELFEKTNGFKKSKAREIMYQIKISISQVFFGKEL